MTVRANRIWNTEDIHYFAEDILNRYYLNLGEENISEVVRKYIYVLAETCAGIFDEDEVWSIIRILKEKECLVEQVLEKSTIQKFTRTSNPMINEHVKEELIDLASNKIIKHVNEDLSEVKEYRTECLTIDSKKDCVKMGELISTLKYSNGGFELNQVIEKNREGFLDFTKDNVLIKIKEDISNFEKIKYVRVIISKKMEKSN